MVRRCPSRSLGLGGRPQPIRPGDGPAPRLPPASPRPTPSPSDSCVSRRAHPPPHSIIVPAGLGEKALHRPGRNAHRFREVPGPAPAAPEDSSGCAPATACDRRTPGRRREILKAVVDSLEARRIHHSNRPPSSGQLSYQTTRRCSTRACRYMQRVVDVENVAHFLTENEAIRVILFCDDFAGTGQQILTELVGTLAGNEVLRELCENRSHEGKPIILSVVLN